MSEIIIECDRHHTEGNNTMHQLNPRELLGVIVIWLTAIAMNITYGMAAAAMNGGA